MSTIVWVIAGGLAATAAMLFGPLNPQGASATGVGPGLLLRVLAAALIGGMVSMPLALAGGIAIGIAESLITYNFNDQRGLLDLLLFVLVLVTLLISGRRQGLAEAGSRTLVVLPPDPADPRRAPRRSGGSDRCPPSASGSSRSSP